MSKYTTELRYICEELANQKSSTGYNSVADVIESSRKSIFSFEYPIFNEQYRPVLETKIIKHFYMNEIGFETFGLWQLALDTKMNEIMPYYNKIYNVLDERYNPLYDTDITTTRTVTETGKKDDTGSEKTVDSLESTTSDSVETKTTNNNTTTDVGSNNQTSGGNSWDYYSDTPQGGINGLENHTYLTNARNVTNSNNSSNNINNKSTVEGENDVNTSGKTIVDSNSTKNRDNIFNSVFNNTQDYVEKTVGKRGAGSYSTIIKEYIESLVNLDMMIIDDLSILFMGLW